MELKDKSTWSVLEVLNYTTDYLANKGIENSRLNAERLLSHSLNINRVELYLNYDRPLKHPELSRFKSLLKRRLNHEPLQYILGETEFMSLLFKVNSSVLIPRPETEILVEKVLELSKQSFGHKTQISILDIGTGSGCIAVSLAKYLESAQVVAVEVSAEALKIAQGNAYLNEVENQLQFIKADFLDSKFSEILREQFDVVVSNPPYVDERDFESLSREIRDYEPAIALRDGDNGLTFYHKIADFSAKHLNPEGFVAVEVGLGQAKQVKDIFSTKEFSTVRVFRDLNGIERVLTCKKL